MKTGRKAALFLGVLGLCWGAIASAGLYDPLNTNSVAIPEPQDFTVHDTARKRDIPVRVYVPVDKASTPVVLFSHGLGGTRKGSAFLGYHWAARGFVAVFLQHPGSDDSVWTSAAPAKRLQAMNGAASAQNFLWRVRDVPAVIDQLATWNVEKGHPLETRLDLKKIGMSGHSFGAVTAQAVSGQSMPVGGQRFTDPRIKAALVLSPSSPRRGTAANAFGSVRIPWMLMTGTKDLSIIGNADLKSRLSVYPALHDAAKYQVVLNKAEHSVFTDRALPGDTERRNPNHHRLILALSTAFWDAYLRGDPAALDWLNSNAPRSIMETEDQWEFSGQ
jgi:predicted dienelactone hydrolase